MKVILIDDELSALIYLEKVLQKIEQIEIIGQYIDPFEAIDKVLSDKPDVVFLDIVMLGINGIEIAEKIQYYLPHVHIVFVTAFDEYAVQAFELNAIDYVLKPIKLSRLKKTIQRVEKYNREKITFNNSKDIPMICTFQALSFTPDSSIHHISSIRWRTSKVRGVFTFLLQHRGMFIRKDTLLDLFWSNLEVERGYTQLYSAIYQLRKTLIDNKINIHITNLENGYKLDLNEVKLDIEEWENGLKELPIVTKDTLWRHRSLLALYRGDYLANEDYIWAENERERLKTLWIKHISKVADFLMSEQQFHEAISLYLRLQTAHPYTDVSYFKLMQLYNKIGNHQFIELQYDALKQMLLDQYAIEPSATIQQWYRNWKQSLHHS